MGMQNWVNCESANYVDEQQTEVVKDQNTVLT